MAEIDKPIKQSIYDMAFNANNIFTLHSSRELMGILIKYFETFLQE